LTRAELAVVRLRLRGASEVEVRTAIRELIEAGLAITIRRVRRSRGTSAWVAFGTIAVEPDESVLLS
jgi:hypothetical protein